MISVVVSIGDVSPHHRSSVVGALRNTLLNPEVIALYVLTELPCAWLSLPLSPLAARLHVRTESIRPTFRALIDFSNTLLEEGPIAIMNSNVSLSCAEDVARLERGLIAVNDSAAPTVFALARRERELRGSRIELFGASGLPNLMSADAWIFARPVHLLNGASYYPGEVNSEMMLAQDLLEAGHSVYNPCLDISLLHYGPPNELLASSVTNTAQTLKEPYSTQVFAPAEESFNFSRIPWVSSSWLQAGYRPKPLSVHAASLQIAFDTGCSDAALLQMVQTISHACELLVYGDPDVVFDRYRSVFCACPDLRLVLVNQPLEVVRKHYLQGQYALVDRVAMVHDLSAVTPRLLAAEHHIFVAYARPGTPMLSDFGCTLVTSIFRSDDFLRGFLRNCRSLDGYGRFIDHIFLVADLSPTELSLLDEMLRDYPSVIVIWHRKDPGLYECWNIGIRAARRRFVSNANVDDLRDPAQVRVLMHVLEEHPEVYVAATALNPFYTYPPDGDLPTQRAGWYSEQAGLFGFFDLARLTTVSDGSPRLKAHNMPHCMPVWHRSLHERYGWFNEDRYGTYADWAFWLKTLQNGGYGWLHPESLSFYYVNPTSHNRRGTELVRLHGVIEADFMPAFQARAAGFPQPVSVLPKVPAKLRLTGLDHCFGMHRNSFNKLIEALLPLDMGREGIVFVPFIERFFVWGNDEGEAASVNPRPIERDWIGILHVPFDAPDWFELSVKPETIFETPLWRDSLPKCLGIITLARDLEADLNYVLPSVPTLSLHHPVEMDVELFDVVAYRARPQVVQVGDWLRKLQAIHRLRAPGHKRIMLLKEKTRTFLQREIATFGDHLDVAVDMCEMVPNNVYDRLLSTSVVLCLLYGTAANNAVIECIARATPILVNPLPAVVEYLGVDYPLYARSEAEADLLLATPGAVEAAHRYLLIRRIELDLSYAAFCRAIATSPFYGNLKP